LSPPRIAGRGFYVLTRVVQPSFAPGCIANALTIYVELPAPHAQRGHQGCSRRWRLINRAALDVESVRVAQKQVNDFVTEVDQAAERIIIETLLNAYPQHSILAEESGSEHGAKNSDHVWIIDPLDGTTNFIHGFPVLREHCPGLQGQDRARRDL
jgi:hypothetical protein